MVFFCDPMGLDLESYLMRKDEHTCDCRYLFMVNSDECVVRVEVIPSSGGRLRVYERVDEKPLSLKYFVKIHVIDPVPERFRDCGDAEYLRYLASDEHRNASRWEETQPSLVNRLGVRDPIVRDAFNPGTLAGVLFMHHHLVSDSGVRA